MKRIAPIARVVPASGSGEPLQAGEVWIASSATIQ